MNFVAFDFGFMLVVGTSCFLARATHLLTNANASAVQLKSFICSYPDVGPATLDAMPEIECWTSAHVPMVLISMLFLPPYVLAVLKVVSQHPHP